MRIHTAYSRQYGAANRPAKRRTNSAKNPPRRIRYVTEDNWESRLYTFWSRVVRIIRGVDFGDQTDRRDRIRSLIYRVMMVGMPESAIVEVLQSLPEWKEWKLGSTVRSCRRRVDLAGGAEIAIPDWPYGRIMKRLRIRHRNKMVRQKRIQQRAEETGLCKMVEQRPDWETRPIPPGNLRFATEGE